MKTILFTRKAHAAILGGLIAVVLAITSITAFPSTAYAADETPDKGTEIRDARLTRIYQGELKWLDLQQQRLDGATKIADKAEKLIEKAKEKGLDVTELEAALSTFKSQISDAQKVHDTAASILASHNGFDANGKVVDKDDARQTVKDAGQSLREARRIMVQAGRDLRAAVRSWRLEHMPKVEDKGTNK